MAGNDKFSIFVDSKHSSNLDYLPHLMACEHRNDASSHEKCWHYMAIKLGHFKDWTDASPNVTRGKTHRFKFLGIRPMPPPFVLHSAMNKLKQADWSPRNIPSPTERHH